MSALHPAPVNALFESVIATDGIAIEGILGMYVIDVPLLEKSADKVDAFIAELDPTFHTKGGGGWSFLNLCNDRHGNLWTGEHRTMEQLCVMAIALGKARWLMPRALWSALPGEMPYVGFDAP